jgi:hypothetical protein
VLSYLAELIAKTQKSEVASLRPRLWRGKQVTNEARELMLCHVEGNSLPAAAGDIVNTDEIFETPAVALHPLRLDFAGLSSESQLLRK